MLRLTAERGSPAKDPRAHTVPDTGKRQEGIAHCSARNPNCPVSSGRRASNHILACAARITLAFAALVAAVFGVCLLGGILCHGPAILAAGLFVVAMMVLAREEGLL